MGTPIAVMGDQVQGTCAVHQLIGPLGVPVPTPLPFVSPLTLGLCPTVLVSGKPVAVVGSSGMCTPPHVGLHASDPFLAPPMQLGEVTVGSPTVTAGGQPVARTGSMATCCKSFPGQVMGTGATVLVA